MLLYLLYLLIPGINFAADANTEKIACQENNNNVSTPQRMNWDALAADARDAFKALELSAFCTLLIRPLPS